MPLGTCEIRETHSHRSPSPGKCPPHRKVGIIGLPEQCNDRARRRESAGTNYLCGGGRDEGASGMTQATPALDLKEDILRLKE
ncbi:MAG: hypothetical protein GWO24_38470, partial [Akkermansiaceae bacterium]|nr:hypothetical protein [Akkermansiaceae bacterium]